MAQAVARDPIYCRHRFPEEDIGRRVRRCITYQLSYRDLVEMMAERGIAVLHTTILRWVLRHIPEFDRRWARHARRVNAFWRVDETAVSGRAGQYSLYYAVDKHSKSFESLLCTERAMTAAQA